MTREVTTFFGKYHLAFQDKNNNQASCDIELKAKGKVTEDGISTSYTYDSVTQTITFESKRWTGYTIVLTCYNGEITGGTITSELPGSSSYQLTLIEL